MCVLVLGCNQCLLEKTGSDSWCCFFYNFLTFCVGGWETVVNEPWQTANAAHSTAHPYESIKHTAPILLGKIMKKQMGVWMSSTNIIFNITLNPVSEDFISKI